MSRDPGQDSDSVSGAGEDLGICPTPEGESKYSYVSGFILAGLVAGENRRPLELKRPTARNRATFYFRLEVALVFTSAALTLYHAICSRRAYFKVEPMV